MFKGHSRGESGPLALAPRYPNVFAAAYASEPMTNYQTSVPIPGVSSNNWAADASIKWGEPLLNLPVEIGAPNHWADRLQSYNRTGVWSWQNHQANFRDRVADDMVPFGVAHGFNDHVIEWTTQAKPAYAAFDSAGRAWGGAIRDAEHGWLSYQGLPFTLDVDGSLAPFQNFSVVKNETVPGFSRYSGNMSLPPNDVEEGNYNQTLEWSASWSSWDGAPLDTPNQWRISLRTTDGRERTVDITPRRLQQFNIVPGTTYRWENRRVTDNGLVAGGNVVANANGLITVPNLSVTGRGNRLVIVRQ